LAQPYQDDVQFAPLVARIRDASSRLRLDRAHWRPDLGFMLEAMSGAPDRDTLYVWLVRIYLLYTEQDANAAPNKAIEIVLPDPCAMTFMGVFIDKAARIVRIGDRLSFVINSGAVVSFEWSDDAWRVQCSAADNSINAPLPSAWDDASPMRHYSGDVAVFARALSPEGGDALTWSNEDIEAYLTEALVLVARASPQMIAWIGDSVTCLFTYDGFDSDTLISGSAPIRPGAIAIGYQRDKVILAEQLVHEATHQYLFMLDRFKPTINGEDENLYYSPIKKMDRPLHATLAGYHAVVNMMLFHRFFMDEAGPQGARTSRRRYDYFHSMLPSYDEALLTTNGLSDSGAALHAALKETSEAALC
ncbi:MAG: HEXXH motif-containing putative peptide modification protein, partial [Pseudomonadota bacterium]